MSSGHTRRAVQGQRTAVTSRIPQSIPPHMHLIFEKWMPMTFVWSFQHLAEARTTVWRGTPSTNFFKKKRGEIMGDEFVCKKKSEDLISEILQEYSVCWNSLTTKATHVVEQEFLRGLFPRSTIGPQRRQYFLAILCAPDNF